MLQFQYAFQQHILTIDLYISKHTWVSIYRFHQCVTLYTHSGAMSFSNQLFFHQYTFNILSDISKLVNQRHQNSTMRLVYQLTNMQKKMQYIRYRKSAFERL